MIKKLLKSFWGWIKPYLTPRMIPIIITIWFITNGTWYVIAFAPLGLPSWFTIFAKSYLAFLWSPIAIEKPLIIAVSVCVYRIVYREKFVKQVEGGQDETSQ